MFEEDVPLTTLASKTYCHITPDEIKGGKYIPASMDCPRVDADLPVDVLFLSETDDTVAAVLSSIPDFNDADLPEGIEEADIEEVQDDVIYEKSKSH